MRFFSHVFHQSGPFRLYSSANDVETLVATKPVCKLCGSTGTMINERDNLERCLQCVRARRSGPAGLSRTFCPWAANDSVDWTDPEVYFKRGRLCVFLFDFPCESTCAQPVPKAQPVFKCVCVCVGGPSVPRTTSLLPYPPLPTPTSFLTLNAEHLSQFQSGASHFAQRVDDSLGVGLRQEDV